jgi:hypothetical protein
MLSQDQINHVWDSLLAAETRALYFSDLASTYARQKQWITGLSFFLSSGAAATLIGKLPAVVPIVLSLVTAALTAYSIATGLDRKTSTMAKLASTWREIAAAYDRLWNHTYDIDAEKQLDEIIESERMPSDLAATDAPIDEKRLTRWQSRVFRLHRLPEENAA